MKNSKLILVFAALLAFSSFNAIPYRAVSASTTIVTGDDTGAVVNTGAAVTFTLGTVSTGFSCTLVNHGTGNITLTPAVTNQNGHTITTIEFEATSITPNVIGNRLRVIYDGTIWRAI